ncbi:MAG TPA: histidine--tRNA ligase [Flavitalea sp.]|nr:histidine--tRNA ligase [Flavitalea sp.]
MSKPTLPQGTRDFSPATVRKRNYILSTIRNVFELYGFQPLETPALENLETLMGKYGEEGDKLIFRILNNGLNDPKNLEKARAAFENTLQGKNDKNLTERALRYDLTIPFARYVAMNHGQLVYPFKRYQIQPVWRADRPQKGRYREFYQCDADVVGSRSLINEADLALIYHEVFSKLKLEGYELRINSRKIIAALAEKCGGIDKMTDISLAIDKLDKIGIEKVKEELFSKNISDKNVDLIETYLKISGTNENRLATLQIILNAQEGIQELSSIIDQTKNTGINLVIDFTLARGLNYYTGIIFEAKAPPTVQIGSIGGGGRYDDLTGLFGVPDVPGVGISFGVDRIYDVLEEMNLFPEALNTSTTLLFFNEGDVNDISRIARILRTRNISCEIYPDADKEDKQFKYAKRKNIPYIVTLNTSDKNYKLKNIKTGISDILNADDLVNFIFS